MKKVGLCAAAIFLMALGVQAQEKNEQPNSQVPEMPTLRSPIELDPMLTTGKDILSFGVDQQSGEPAYYLDPKSKLYFDFRQREIRNFNTGETYSFDELGRQLRKEESMPKPERKKEVSTFRSRVG